MSLIDYSSKDYDSLRKALLQLATDKLPEGAWNDQSPNDLGVMLLELVAAVGDSLFYNQDRIAAENFLETAVERRSLVQLLRLIGYELKPALAASADLTLLFKRDGKGPVTIKSPNAFASDAKVTRVPIGYQYIQPTAITIDDISQLPIGIIDDKGKVRLNPLDSLLPGNTRYRVYQTIPVVQIDANVSGEIVASSDGSSRQRYALKRAPIVDSTIAVMVGDEQWKLVPSLLESGNYDRHYCARRDENGVVTIEFGDGTCGMVPHRGINNIVASYGVGGGAKGNVQAGAISKLVTTINQLKLVYNENPASGGTEPEESATAVQRAPALFRSMRRAVTASDYEALAKSFGVSKARATAPSWNYIQLIVAPAGGGKVSDTLREDLLAFLESKRIMTTIVTIADPRYAEVYLDAKVFVYPQFLRQLVQQQVQDAVARLFTFDNVDFGQVIYLSKIYETIQDVEGVSGAVVNIFAHKDKYKPDDPTTWMPTGGYYQFSPDEIPVWPGFTTDFKLDMQGGLPQLSPGSAQNG